MPRHPHRTATSRRCAVAAALLVGALALPAPGSATPLAPAAPRQQPVVAPGQISPELAAVPVDSSAFRAARARQEEATEQLEGVRRARAGAETELADLAARDAALTESIGAATTTRKAAVRELAAARAGLSAFATEAYVRAGSVDELTASFDPEDVVAAQQVQVYGSSGRERFQVRADAALAERDTASDAINRDQGERLLARARVTEVDALRSGAAAEEQRLTASLVQLAVDVEVARVSADVLDADFPLVVLDAYWRGAAAARVESPACGVQWWALAGISRVEGRHGTFGGATVDQRGDVSPRIIGIQLNGTNNTAVINDSDGGQLDGDAAFDRAVGPMQFIPTTWARWGRDGNGDGIVDPHNLYDAAAAAGAYLCAAGPLTDDPGMIRAFLSYNRSQAYAELVLSHARDYSTLPVP